MERKGQVWVSATIYVLIIVTALVIILAATQPLINRMRDKAAVQKQKETMTSLDEQISGVAQEGPGSQRVVPIDIMDGQITVANEGLTYSVETESKVIEPRSQVELGNLKLSSGTDVKASEEINSYILENSRIQIYFAMGNITDTNKIIKNITLLSTNATIEQDFEFNIGDDDGTTLSSNSYTELLDQGTGLGTAQLKAHCNQSEFIYDLIFTLDSEADFIKVDLENVERK